MSEDIEIQEFNEYLEDLYQWITEKYNLLVNDPEYTEEMYHNDLKYYEDEKSRIERKFEAQEQSKEQKKNTFLTQEKFESFFGVSIEAEEEAEKKVEEEEIRKASEEYQQRRAKIEEEMLRKTQRAIEDKIDDIPEEEEIGKEAINYDVFEEQIPSIDPNKTHVSILLIGDSTSGRTSIRRAVMGKHFIDRHLTTIGASMDSVEFDVDGHEYETTIIDLGGQDFYRGIRSNFYRKIDGAMIVFDLSKRETFMRLDHWVTEFYRSIKTLVPFIIVGNKADIKNREVKEKEGVRVAENYSRKTMPRFKIRYIETSAKNKINIHESFDILIREIRAFKAAKLRKKTNAY